MNTNLGKVLHKIVQELETTQEAFAASVELSQSRLNKLMNGPIADPKSRATPQCIGAIYVKVLPIRPQLARAMIAANGTDNFLRGNLAEAGIPKICGVCLHWEIDPDNPRKGRCKGQDRAWDATACDCFTLGEI